MRIYAAIDVKDGQVVRLARGKMEAATVYGDDPVARVEVFAAQGFRWLHVVDLNGAIEGKAVNGEVIVEVVRAAHRCGMAVQCGGGIRTLARMEELLEQGVARVVLGTVAVRDGALLREACAKWPGKVAAALDMRGGRVAVSGWVEEEAASSMAKAVEGFVRAGVAAVVYTAIERDGMGTGLDMESLEKVLALCGETKVVASGGVASAEDVRALAKYGQVEGVIIGRALYEGKVRAEDVLC